METAEIIVSIYQAYKPGVPGKLGPEGLKTYIGLAGVSEISTRPEFFGLIRHLPANTGEIGIEHEVGGIGSAPWRKLVTISLPDHVHYGKFDFANCHMCGLYCDYKANDGMGPCVGAACAVTQIVKGEWESAIDAAIDSGIVLSVPTERGGREDVRAKVISVSPIYGNTFPE